MSGYTRTEDEAVPFKVPENVDQTLDLKPGIPVAGLVVYASLSWMPKFSSQMLSALSTEEHIGRLALKRYLQRHTDTPTNTGLLLPPHTLIVTTDRYDSDPEQRLLQSIIFSDGFGRTLQTSVRHEAGDAWLLNERDAAIVADETGHPKNQFTMFRWAVSGRTEFDAKGRPRRTYLPYFLNTWRYVNDDFARQDLFADTTSFDALGRENSVITAAGWLRRTLTTPWFVVSEDETIRLLRYREVNYDVP